jgi:hypothetical protein
VEQVQSEGMQARLLQVTDCGVDSVAGPAGR